MGKQADIHVKILTASSTDELMGVYDGWADAYEQELLEEWGYTSPQKAVQLLSDIMTLQGMRVLDAGCGTGLVGALLKKSGAASLTGIDYSPGMLAKAEAKQVYDSLDKMDMNEPLPLPSNSFDATTCIGTFTATHVKPDAVRELVRVTRSGGALIFTVRDDYWQATNFIDLITELHVEKLVFIEQIRLEPYIHSEGSECRFVVLRVR
ncbi:MAG: class I SAM-dependent DNA methyltransferase [Luminiphilus sp.]|jgi:predicted TPR repeat methyltransferase